MCKGKPMCPDCGIPEEHTKRAPFQMKPSRMAVLICDGKHVTTGRASFAWETYLMRRASGVPGRHFIRRGEKGAPWHELNFTIEEAEHALSEWGTFAHRRLDRARKLRAERERRGLEVG